MLSPEPSAAAATAPPRGRTIRILTQAVPLVVILVLGIELRLIFHQGIIYTDDLAYSQLARRLADGMSPFAKPVPSESEARRIGLYAPAAAAYRLFGTNDATTLAWPFACSILSLLGAYGIGRLVHNEASGLLAAFLVAVLPTSVAAATALLGDGPVGALGIATVWCLLIAHRTDGWKSGLAILCSLASFTAGMLNKPVILLLLPFVLVYVLTGMKRSFATIAGCVLAIAVAAAGYAANFAGLTPVPQGFATTMTRVAMTATDVWQQLVLGRPEFSWIAPLWIVAAAALLAWRRAEARTVLLWVGVTFLYGELGTRTLTSYTPIVWYDLGTPGRHFLFIAAPAMVLTAIYLAQGLKNETTRRVVVFASIVTGVCAWAGSRGAANMTWGVTGERLEDLPFATISGLATIVVVFGGIASPALIRAEAAVVRVGATVLLVLAIGLASLNQSYRAANEYKGPWIDTFPEALRFLAAQPPMPIVVQNGMVGQRLDYLSGFRLGFYTGFRPNVRDPRISLAPAAAAALTDAYVLVDEYHLANARAAGVSEGPAYLRTPPERWVRLAEFGRYRGNRVAVYRAVSDGSAAAELAAAREAVAAARTTSTLRQLLGWASAAGAPCEAVKAWQELRTTAPESIGSFQALPILTRCYTTNPGIAGPNLFQNGDFSAGLASWASHTASDAIVEVERDLAGAYVWHSTYRGGDWSTIAQQQVLQPDTPYVYEALMRSTAPVISLYWQAETGRHFEDAAYPAWTPLHYVFVTPHWDGTPRSVMFLPVLMTAPAEVWIKDLRLSALTRPPP